MEKKYIVSESLLYDMLSDSLTLNMLFDGGVDNWMGYDEAIRDGMKELNEIHHTNLEWPNAEAARVEYADIGLEVYNG